MMRQISHFALVVLAAGLLGCGGGDDVLSRSPLDTADAHYRRGLTALDEGDLWTAQAEFERALALDGGFPGGYVGTALVAAEQGDFWRARKQIEQAFHRDGDFGDAHLALGRIAAAEGIARGRDGASWLAEARRSFQAAARLARGQPEPFFYLAEAELEAGQLEEARLSYQRVVEINRGPLVARAMAQLERVHAIESATPGSQLGQRIAAADMLTRAELAVLLLEELRLEDLIRQRRAPGEREPAFHPPAPVPSEVEQRRGAESEAELQSTWARPWIERILALGVPGLEPLPDRSFRPDETVTRAMLARVNEGILTLLTTEPDLATRYVGESSRFADVDSGHFAYNAIALSVDRGIMSPDTVTGRFRPDDPVSGAEALLIIRQLQNAVRMEF